MIEAVERRRRAGGPSFGASTCEAEVELAEAVLGALSLRSDKLRFVSTGTEAVMSAVRLARGFDPAARAS